MATQAKTKSKIAKLYNKPVKALTNPAGALSKEAALLKVAQERARDGATFWQKNWDAAFDDLKFLAGEQWPDQVRTQRENEQRPCLTNNVLPTFVDQILGDQRQNRPSIKVSAVDTHFVTNTEGKQEELKIPNRAGDKDYSLSEAFTGAIRNIEYDSDAETAYDIAFQSAVESGFGYLRVLTDYASDEGFDQEIQIKAIANQFSVTFDPSAKERDYSDAGWCLIDENMLKEQFEAQYPDASAEPVSDSTNGYDGVWFSEKTVRVSEYFTRKPVVRDVALLSDGRMVFVDELEQIVDELLEMGINIERTRPVKTYEVYWHKISGANILEGPIKLDCSTIPVVPVWGKSITLKKETMFRSAIRFSKDAQAMANYWDTAATESVALAPKAPFIGSAEQIEGYEDDWKNANTSNLSLLRFNRTSATDTGPRREQPAAVPAAEITLGMNSTDKIKATMGMFDASIGAAGNETSGRAIIARQRESDVGSFAFTDNLSKALRRIGKILVEMIPRVYDTERQMRLKFEDETEDYVLLNQSVLDEETNEWVTINDLGVAKYDVVVKTGPAYTTQRQEAADAMLQFAQAVPSAAAVMADLIAQNMDWPGADAITARLKKIVPPNVLTQKEREANEADMPEVEETPEQKLMMKELEVKVLELGAKEQEIQSDVEKSRLELEQTKAETVQAELETEQARIKLAEIEAEAVQSVSMLEVKELIAEALTQLLPSPG